MHDNAYALRIAVAPTSQEDRKAESSTDEKIIGMISYETDPRHNRRKLGWIAPPERGINDLPVLYDYVNLH